MKNNIHLQRIMISVLTVALVLGVTVCPVFATDYIYTTRSAFCTAINSELSFTANTYTSTYFIDTLGSDYSNLLSSLITNYSLSNDSNFRFLVLCDLGSYKWIYLMTFDNDDYYVYQTNLNSTLPSNNFVFSVATNLDIYDVNSANNTLTYSHRTLTDKSTYNWQPTQKARFAGMYPYNAAVKTSSSAVNTFVLNLSDAPSPEPGGSYPYIVMNKPPTIYGNLWATLHNAAWDDVAAEYPSVYQNVERGEFMFSDTSPGMNANNIFSAINVCGVLFESYMAHSYDFYDNISYNLATYMNSMQELNDNISSIAQVYEDLYPEDAREMTATMEEELYDSENGGTSLTEMQTVFGVGTESRDAFDTGASFSLSGLFSFKNDGNWGFWSTQCQNDMDNVPQVRKSENYDSTAYNDQLEELMSIWGVGNNGK